METHSFTNELIKESSPYLLQHAHNPVNWKPYNEKTLQEANNENKLIIISIGYAACHWCHVMENESFEDTSVAAVMNNHYISIKVDREERPDVDQIYINAVQLMTGSAGWPLNVIALPDGRPVWGGTYFRKEDWINALEQIQKIYTEEPEKLFAYANRLEEGLKTMDLVHFNTDQIDFDKYHLNSVVKKMAQSFDLDFGGSKGAPKFMMPNKLSFLLRQSVETNDKKLLEYVTLTLDKMAFGGLYDQIGGGFARYSTDEKWHIPHFEKMLYDNAQLVSLYSNAYAVTKKPLYKEVVMETLEFIERELTDSEGGFYSSLDADSVNKEGDLEEGAFYVFNKVELQQILKEDFSIFKEYYNINNYGYWEKDYYVLIRKKTDPEIQDAFKLSPDVLRNKKAHWKRILLDSRSKKSRPRLDDKTLTSWNALMLKGYVDAYKIFSNPAYLTTALKNANFIAQHQMQKNGKLFHNYKKGKTTINGFLEDYAFTIAAFIDLYQVTMDKKWLEMAGTMTEYTLTNFFDPEKHMFYFTSKEDPAILVRNFEYRDNVIPASNSEMANNLFLLSKYSENNNFENISSQMLHNILPEIEPYPSGFTNWLLLMANFQGDFYEVVVTGNEAGERLKELNKEYLPNKIIAGSAKDSNDPLFKNRFVHDETLIYICVDKACKMPLNNTESAIEILKKNTTF